MFETVIEVLKRVIKAYKQHKGLADVLTKYRRELERVRDLSESVRNEKALKKAKVSEPLTRLKELEGKLCDWLANVDPGDKKSLRRFADQLSRGQDDRKKLDDIMKELDRIKSDLQLAINMHHTTMSHDIRKAVVPKSKNATRASRKPEKNHSNAGESNLAVRTKVQTNSKDIDRGP
jgi:hypothetical protein